MSTWDSQFDASKTGKSVANGKTVDSMIKIGEDSDGTSLFLKCPTCETKFWFKPVEGGRNSKQFTYAMEENGPVEKHIHAICPQCRSDWNGTEPKTCFALVMTINNANLPFPVPKEGVIICAVEADNMAQALPLLKFPDGYPEAYMSEKATIEKCTQKEYKLWKEGMNNTEKVQNLMKQVIEDMKQHLKTKSLDDEIMDSLKN